MKSDVSQGHPVFFVASFGSLLILIPFTFLRIVRPALSFESNTACSAYIKSSYMFALIHKTFLYAIDLSFLRRRKKEEINPPPHFPFPFRRYLFLFVRARVNHDKIRPIYYIILIIFVALYQAAVFVLLVVSPNVGVLQGNGCESQLVGFFVFVALMYGVGDAMCALMCLALFLFPFLSHFCGDAAGYSEVCACVLDEAAKTCTKRPNTK